MGYKCVVLIKQVPDTKRITGDVMNDDGTDLLIVRAINIRLDLKVTHSLICISLHSHLGGYPDRIGIDR